MNRRNLILLTVLVAVLAFCIVSLVYPLFGRTQMQLGLDLKGGVRLVYQANFPEGSTKAQQDLLLDQAVTVIQTRIDKFGVASPTIQAQKSNGRIVVELPGFADLTTAKKLVEETAFLEFREVELNSKGNAVYLSDYLDETALAFFDTIDTGPRYFVDSNGALAAVLQADNAGNLGFIDANGKAVDVATLKAGDVQELSWIVSRGDSGVQLTGSLLSSAKAEVSTQTTGSKADIAIEWNSEGTTIFDQVAKRLYARPADSAQRDLGIFLDRNLISAPQIQVQSYGGKAVITGNFTLQSATILANQLSSGALPIQETYLYGSTVSPTLGSNFTEMAVVSGIIAFVLITLFMIVYYRVSGAMAALALIFYAAVIMAIFKLWPVTLSLAGIGGFVLSLGMAVDANVIIFERMKEEIRNGRTLGAAIEAGFDRAWLAIRDSNITTFISCLILIWIGGIVPNGQAVRGFGITLFIGVAVSMFTCITVTRTLLRMFVNTKIGQKTSRFSTLAGRK
jgi:preprotein translocase subunit SecD